MAIISKATNRIDIVVSAEYSSNDNNTQDASTSPKENQEEKDNEEKVNISRSKRITRTLLTHSMASGIQMTFQTLNYAVGGVGTYTGDESYQNYQQRQLEIFQDSQNVISSFGLNAMYGFIYSGGNPLVAGANALIGGASSLTSKYFKYAARHREYNFKVFKENNAIEYNRARANINLTYGRLR